jgi:hypothetical protein
VFPWLDTKSAAKYVLSHADTLRRWRREGCGPSFSKRGKFIRYHVEELDAWLRSHQVASNAEASELARGQQEGAR